MRACLDAWAVLAWLDGEQPAAERVDAVMADRPTMSWINAVEVYYRVDRDHGRQAADETLADIRAVVDMDLPGVARMVGAARIKSQLAIALGDCFALATAAAHNVPLLTGDPEIVALPEPPCAIEDLRAQSV